MQAGGPGFQLNVDWHDIEKVLWLAGSLTAGLLITIARPFLAKQIIKLLKEDQATYRAFEEETWKETLTKLNTAAANAEEALRMVQELKTKTERLESASNEQGLALAGLESVPHTLEKMENSISDFLRDFQELRIVAARLDERNRSTNYDRS